MQGTGADAIGRLPRLLDHRLHPDRPAPRHQRRPEEPDRRRAHAQGHEGLLRHHHQPHRRRHRLRSEAPVRRTSPRTTSPVQGRRRQRLRRPRLRRHRHASRRSTPRRRSRTRRCFRTPAEQDRQGPGLAQRPDAVPQPRRLDLRRREQPSTATSSASTTCSPSSPRSSTGMIDIYKTWVETSASTASGSTPSSTSTSSSGSSSAPAHAGYAAARRQPELLHVRRGLRRRPGRHVALRHARAGCTATLDFPFQDAAPSYVAQGGSADRAAPTSSPATTTYTDADSNAYELPTFLGNHDMGRIGYFLKAGNAGADDAELLQRDRLAHELMFLTRGNRSSTTATSRASPAPAATRTPGRTCSPARSPSYADDDVVIGADAPAATDRYDTNAAALPARSRAGRAARRATRRWPTARRSHRYAQRPPASTPSAGSTPTSRSSTSSRANNATTADDRRRSRRYGPNATFEPVYGGRHARARPTRTAGCTVTVPPLSVRVSARRPTVAVAVEARRPVYLDLAGSPAATVGGRAEIGVGRAGRAASAR